MSAVLSVVPKLEPRPDSNADVSSDELAQAYAHTLKKLIKTAPEQLSTKDIVFYLIASTYGPDIALSMTSTVLRSGSLGHVLADAGLRLRERSPELSDFWLLCEVIRTMMKQISSDELKRKHLQIKDWATLADYLRHTLAYEKEECFRILHLDSCNSLLDDELHSRGVANHVPVYPIKVVRSVLEHGSKGVILLHNHPSHSAEPSEDDRQLTSMIERALDSIEVRLLDHVIVCGSRYVSMRGMGLIGA